MKTKFLVDAGSIAEPNRSGVGHTAYHIVHSLASDVDFIKRHEIILVVAFNKTRFIDDDLKGKVRIKKVYLPGRIMNALVRYRLLPPMDIFFGQGIYLFPNFKNWPLVRSKSITYIHDLYFRVNREHIEPRNLSFLEQHVETFIRRADRIVTVSHHAKKEIEKYFPNAKGKVSVVYNGIDKAEFYQRGVGEQKNVGREYGVTPGEYFMYLSNLEPRKNVGALLEAYELYINQTHKKIKLILIGGMGWKNEKIITKIQQLQTAGYDVVRPTAYVPDQDIPALLSGAIALIHPAFYEGFGISPLQAMVCNIPVIVGNNSSIPEVVGPDYVDYVDITDPQAIANKMKEVSTSKQTSKNNRHVNKFTWQKSTSDLKKIVLSLEYNK